MFGYMYGVKGAFCSMKCDNSTVRIFEVIEY